MFEIGNQRLNALELFRDLLLIVLFILATALSNAVIAIVSLISRIDPVFTVVVIPFLRSIAFVNGIRDRLWVVAGAVAGAIVHPIAVLLSSPFLLVRSLWGRRYLAPFRRPIGHLSTTLLFELLSRSSVDPGKQPTVPDIIRHDPLLLFAIPLIVCRTIQRSVNAYISSALLNT